MHDIENTFQNSFWEAPNKYDKTNYCNLASEYVPDYLSDTKEHAEQVGKIGR